MLSCGDCPSVTFLNYAKTNKDIFEIFSTSGSTQYVESIYRPKYYTVTLKYRLRSLKVTNGTIG